MDRFLSCLLMEIDGISSKTSYENSTNRPSVVLVATSESRSLIDPALLRPGRLSIQIHVTPPDFSARAV